MGVTYLANECTTRSAVGAEITAIGFGILPHTHEARDAFNGQHHTHVVSLQNSGIFKNTAKDMNPTYHDPCFSAQ